MSFGAKTVWVKLTPDYYFLAHEKWSTKVEVSDAEEIKAFKKLLADVGANIIPMGLFFALALKEQGLENLHSKFTKALGDEDMSDCVGFELRQPHYEGRFLEGLQSPVLGKIIQKITIRQNGQDIFYDCQP